MNSITKGLLVWATEVDVTRKVLLDVSMFFFFSVVERGLGSMNDHSSTTVLTSSSKCDHFSLRPNYTRIPRNRHIPEKRRGRGGLKLHCVSPVLNAPKNAGYSAVTP